MIVALIEPGSSHIMHAGVDALGQACPGWAIVGDGQAGIVPPPQSQVNELPLFEQSVYCEQRWPPVPVGALLDGGELLLALLHARRTMAASMKTTFTM